MDQREGRYRARGDLSVCLECTAKNRRDGIAADAEDLVDVLVVDRDVHDRWHDGPPPVDRNQGDLFSVLG